MNSVAKIKNELKLWNKLSIIVPTFSSLAIGILYILNLIELTVIFYIGCVLYFFTAIVWWFWTMKNILLLTELLNKSQQELDIVITEIKNIKNEFI